MMEAASEVVLSICQFHQGGAHESAPTNYDTEHAKLTQ